MPFGVAGRLVEGPKTNTAFAGRGGALPPAMSPVAIAARGGKRIHRRCPAALFPVPGSSMNRSTASTPRTPSAMLELPAPLAPVVV